MIVLSFENMIVIVERQGIMFHVKQN